MTTDLIGHAPMLLCLGLLAGAALSDLTSYTIPNRLVAGIVALYPFHLALGAGAPSWGAPVAALAVLAAGFGLFAWGKMGAGDVKLAAAAVLWIGAADTAAFLVVTALAGGALSVLFAGPYRFPLARVALSVGVSRLHDGLIARDLPYGVAIAAGAFAALAPRLPG
ncbi:A24 family peptidase [Arenibaculum pallidiluteum]|uniref:A24 family peptidase n=1 Tax=Arenibaculum pallidiluteum TaxID=2812559 RepID=UPI001A96F294|nr:prepilin peptidase [Arenibaculum pallidiluteum]